MSVQSDSWLSSRGDFLSESFSFIFHTGQYLISVICIYLWIKLLKVYDNLMIYGFFSLISVFLLYLIPGIYKLGFSIVLLSRCFEEFLGDSRDLIL